MTSPLAWRVWFAAVLLSVGLGATAQPPAGPTAPGSAPAAAAATGQRRMGPAVGVPTLGMPFIHDPSTVVHFRGKYYVFGTGPGITYYSSPDAEAWTREKPVFERIPDEVHAGVPKNNGVDVWASSGRMGSFTCTTPFRAGSRSSRQLDWLRTQPWTRAMPPTGGRIAAWW